MQLVQPGLAVRSGASPLRAALLLLALAVGAESEVGPAVLPLDTHKVKVADGVERRGGDETPADAFMQRPRSIEGSGSVAIGDTRILESQRVGAVRDTSPSGEAAADTRVRVKVHTKVRFANAGDSVTRTYTTDSMDLPDLQDIDRSEGDVDAADVADTPDDIGSSDDFADDAGNADALSADAADITGDEADVSETVDPSDASFDDFAASSPDPEGKTLQVDSKQDNVRSPVDDLMHNLDDADDVVDAKVRVKVSSKIVDTPMDEDTSGAQADDLVTDVNTPDNSKDEEDSNAKVRVLSRDVGVAAAEGTSGALVDDLVTSSGVPDDGPIASDSSVLKVVDNQVDAETNGALVDDLVTGNTPPDDSQDAADSSARVKVSSRIVDTAADEDTSEVLADELSTSSDALDDGRIESDSNVRVKVSSKILEGSTDAVPSGALSDASMTGASADEQRSPVDQLMTSPDVRVKVSSRILDGATDAVPNGAPSYNVRVKASSRILEDEEELGTPAPAEERQQRLLRSSPGGGSPPMPRIVPAASLDVLPAIDDEMSEEFNDAVQRAQEVQTPRTSIAESEDVETVTAAPSRGDVLRSHLKGLTDALDDWEPPKESILHAHQRSVPAVVTTSRPQAPPIATTTMAPATTTAQDSAPAPPLLRRLGVRKAASERFFSSDPEAAVQPAAMPPMVYEAPRTDDPREDSQVLYYEPVQQPPQQEQQQQGEEPPPAVWLNSVTAQDAQAVGSAHSKDPDTYAMEMYFKGRLASVQQENHRLRDMLAQAAAWGQGMKKKASELAAERQETERLQTQLRGFRAEQSETGQALKAERARTAGEERRLDTLEKARRELASSQREAVDLRAALANATTGDDGLETRLAASKQDKQAAERSNQELAEKLMQQKAILEEDLVMARAIKAAERVAAEKLRAARATEEAARKLKQVAAQRDVLLRQEMQELMNEKDREKKLRAQLAKARADSSDELRDEQSNTTSLEHQLEESAARVKELKGAVVMSWRKVAQLDNQRQHDTQSLAAVRSQLQSAKVVDRKVRLQEASLKHEAAIEQHMVFNATQGEQLAMEARDAAQAAMAEEQGAIDRLTAQHGADQRESSELRATFEKEKAEEGSLMRDAMEGGSALADLKLVVRPKSAAAAA